MQLLMKLVWEFLTSHVILLEAWSLVFDRLVLPLPILGC